MSRRTPKKTSPAVVERDALGPVRRYFHESRDLFTSLPDVFASVANYFVAHGWQRGQPVAVPALREEVPLSSANSISLGRLLPQMSYYAHSALAHLTATGSEARYVIPSGNLGNALACMWTRRLGLPIGDIRLSCNANRVMPDLLESGRYRPRPVVPTVANAMDVAAPSNLERLLHWHDDIDQLRSAISARGYDDDRLREVMREAPERYGMVVCPHTATALAMIEEARAAGDNGNFIAVATAHPAKFESIVEPLVGHAVEPPPALADCLARPAHAEPMAADYGALRAVLEG